MDILACLQCLQPTVPSTTLRQCRRIALAMLVMTGRVTMLGLSRWAGPGGSYRTVQRFFATVIPWATLFWVFFRHHVYRSEEVYLLVGDEVIVRKASAWASAGQQEHPQSRRDLYAGVMAYHRLARSLAAPDRRGGLLDLRSAGRALWQPQRLADGPAEPPTPDFQAAVRCGT